MSNFLDCPLGIIAELRDAFTERCNLVTHLCFNQKSIIGGSQGLYQNTSVGIQKLYTQHLLPLLMMSQGRFPSSALSSIKVLKSSLKRALLCNFDFPEEPLLCSWIRLAEHHFSLRSIPLHQPTLSIWMIQQCVCVCVLCKVKHPTAALPGAEATHRQVVDDLASEREQIPREGYHFLRTSQWKNKWM